MARRHLWRRISKPSAIRPRVVTCTSCRMRAAVWRHVERPSIELCAECRKGWPKSYETRD